MIDFSKYTIKNIRFEKCNFSPRCFTKHNNNLSNELGMNGMLNKINNNDGNDYIAVLNE
jgi:hypothetical protein